MLAFCAPGKEASKACSLGQLYVIHCRQGTPGNARGVCVEPPMEIQELCVKQDLVSCRDMCRKGGRSLLHLHHGAKKLSPLLSHAPGVGEFIVPLGQLGTQALSRHRSRRTGNGRCSLLLVATGISCATERELGLSYDKTRSER